MTNAQKMSLYYMLGFVDDNQLEIIYRMLQEMTNHQIEIEKLSSEEATEYQSGFDEMKAGNYSTIEEIIAKRDDIHGAVDDETRSKSRLELIRTSREPHGYIRLPRTAKASKTAPRNARAVKNASEPPRVRKVRTAK
jgi:hypothetical protein